METIFEDLANILKQLWRKYNEILVIRAKLDEELKSLVAELKKLLDLDITYDDIKNRYVSLYIEEKKVGNRTYPYLRIYDIYRKRSKYLGNKKQVIEIVNKIRQTHTKLAEIEYAKKEIEHIITQAYENINIILQRLGEIQDLIIPQK